MCQIRTITSTATTLLLLGLCACQNEEDPPLVLETCSAQESPRELLRIETARELRPYDVIDGVLAIEEDYGSTLLVDNCGGKPLELAGSEAMFVDGQVALCGGALTPGISEILASGARGKDLGLGACKSGYASSFGFVRTGDGLVQHLPDGSSRAVPSVGGGELTWLGDAGVVSGGGGVVVLPPGGGEAIVVEGLPRIEFVVPQGNASSWVFLAAYPDPAMAPGSSSELGSPLLYALDLVSGAWLELTEVDGDRLKFRNFASAEDGLVAMVDGRLTFWRPSWGGPGLGDVPGALGVAVIDGERVVVATDDGLQLVRVPFDRPEDENEPLPLEVVWSRPLAEGEPNPTSAGVPWKEVVLVEGTDNVWAYPLDGSDPTLFLPSLGFEESFFPSLGYTHLGEEYVTAMARNPDDMDNFWLYRNSLGGEFEVLDTDIQGAPPLDTLGFISEERYRWTPELGRILYAVRDGNTVSIRQHVLTD